MDWPVSDDEPGAVRGLAQALSTVPGAAAFSLDHLPAALDARVEQPFPQLGHEFVLGSGVFRASLSASPRGSDLIGPEAEFSQLVVGMTGLVELVAVDRLVGEIPEIGRGIDLKVNPRIDVRLVGLIFIPSIHPVFWKVITYRYIGGFT